MSESDDSRWRRASGRTGRFVLEITAAALIGAGVPFLWIWIGSLIQGSRGAQHVEGSTAAIVFVGIIATYVIVLMIAGAIQARGQAEEEQARSATRGTASMRDSPYRPGTDKLSPVEAVFVGTAIVASVAMLIWFFAFAGSPLPT